MGLQFDKKVGSPVHGKFGEEFKFQGRKYINEKGMNRQGCDSKETGLEEKRSPSQNSSLREMKWRTEMFSWVYEVLLWGCIWVRVTDPYTIFSKSNEKISLSILHMVGFLI